VAKKRNVKKFTSSHRKKRGGRQLKMKKENNKKIDIGGHKRINSYKS